MMRRLLRTIINFHKRISLFGSSVRSVSSESPTHRLVIVPTEIFGVVRLLSTTLRYVWPYSDKTVSQDLAGSVAQSAEDRSWRSGSPYVGAGEIPIAMLQRILLSCATLSEFPKAGTTIFDIFRREAGFVLRSRSASHYGPRPRLGGVTERGDFGDQGFHS
jgi:hypothetical protein